MRAGRLAEPPGQNAIELSRQALQMNARCAPCRLLETQAASAYERLARAAVARRDGQAAASMYERLSALYPGRPDYARQAKSSRGPSLVGGWRIRYTYFFTGIYIVKFHPDGTCQSDGGTYGEAPETGTWVLTDASRRAYRVTWIDGVVESLTLSEDGARVHGTTTNRRSAEGRRIE